MSALNKVIQWLNTFPGSERLQSFQVDYYTDDPENGSIAPAGLVEISRSKDILGNIHVCNQYNFVLYYTFPKASTEDEGAEENAEWLLAFQEWIQEQSVIGSTPVFGDEPAEESIKAQNGAIYDATEEGTATYMVQLSIEFIKNYEVKQKW